jgi:hypothetical protein
VEEYLEVVKDKIAPLSDKRPAIPPPAVTDFPDEAPQAPDEMFS